MGSDATFASRLIKKVKAHTRTIERGGLAVRSVPISIDGMEADKIAGAGGISLTMVQAERLQQLLNWYAQYFQVDIAQRSSRKINKQLDSLCKDLTKLSATLAPMNVGPVAVNPDFSTDDGFSVAGQMVFREAAVDLQRFKRELAALTAAAKAQRTFASQRGPHRNSYLLPLMGSLAALYREADGTSTGIHRGESSFRTSPFVDFVWAAMLLLPERMRHSSKKALASWWDKNDPRKGK
jgi:hypothetical protein